MSSELAPFGIAIVGMSGRFPGADDPDELWARVVAGEDCLVDLDVHDLLEAGVPPEVARDPHYVRRSGALADVAGFDPGFFGIGPGDAAIMDPQHRHFLECAWAALESSGTVPEMFEGSIGVFAGCGMNTYLVNNLLTDPTVLQRLGWFLLRHTGNDKDFLVNNVAYRLDLQGPAVNVQTACSTSLVAVHLAVQSLLGFECDLALAGGSTIEVPHGVGYRYHEGEILSPDGRCRAFDAASNGTVLTGGVAVVALRRLADAVDDGDPILAVIKGTAINNDGARKVGFLAPSIDGHAAVVREALGVAGLSARELQLVEAHGTGTAVGDPIEVAALTEAFRSFTDDRGFCRLTSTKPNIGHLDTAAGAASLVKVVQALRHRTLPPLANHTGPNPLLDIGETPFTLSSEATVWPGDRPRRAGVSSLGVGGTNAHVVVEEAPAAAPTAPSRPEQCLVLSARSPGALELASTNLARHLEADPGLELADVAWTLASGRRSMPHRRAVTARDTRHAVELLRAPDRHRRADGELGDGPPSTCFMFPGGGSQYPGMGATLDERFGVFHRVRAEVQTIVADLGGPDLTRCWDPCTPPDLLRAPTVSLPAVFATSLALAQQWMDVGVQPDLLVGHSLGEYVAAHLAGVLSLEDVVSLVVVRSRLMERVGGPHAAMLVVPLPEDRVLELAPPELSLATVNAADECVVAGDAAVVEAFEAALGGQGVSGTRLPLAAAAHSSLLDPVLPEFLDAVRAVPLAAPRRAYPSNLTGTWITPEQATDPSYWVDHLRGTVRFDDCMATLARHGPLALVELGPGQALSSYARRSPVRAAVVAPTMRHPDHDIDDTAFALQSFARLWTVGAAPSVAALVDEGRRRVLLPTYPFEHQRCWIDPGSSRVAPSPVVATVDASEPSRINDLDGACSVVTWVPAPQPEPAEWTSGAWLVVADLNDVLADDVVSELVGRGAEVHRVASMASVPPLATVAGVLLVAPRNGTYADCVERFYAQGPLAIRALPAASGARLVALTRRALPVGGPAEHPAAAMAHGLVAVAAREYPVSGRAIDVDDATSARAVVDDMLAHGEDVIAHRDGVRWRPQVEPARVPEPTTSAFRANGTYVVTGGLGGVGAALATHLAREHQANLVVIATGPVPEGPDRQHWRATHAYDDPTSRRIRRLEELESIGTKVVAVSADLADPRSVVAALDLASARVGPIDGAIHAAGVVRDRLLDLAALEDHHAVLGAKAGGALVLAEELERRGGDLLLLVGSTSVLLTPPGQASYVGANAVLDSLVGRHGPLRVATIDFGLWADTGAASELGRRARLCLPDGDRFDHPVLGERITRADGSSVLSGRVDPLHHWVLDDHRLSDGSAVLPGSAHLELMLVAVQAARGAGFGLADVVLAQPLVVDDGRPATVRVTVGAPGDDMVRVESALDADWRLHAEGVIIAAAQGSPGPGVASDGGPLHCYDPFERQREGLRLGPRWSTAVKGRCDGTGAVARISLGDVHSPEASAWLAHPVLVDTATAVAVSLAPTVPGGPLWVPAGYGTVEVHRRLPAEIWVRVVVSPDSSADRHLFDIEGCGADGEALFRIGALDLRPLTGGLARRPTASTVAPPPSAPRRHTLADLADSHGLTAGEGAALLERLAGGHHDRLIASTIPVRDLQRLAGAPDRSTAVADAATGPASSQDVASLEAAIAAIWCDLLGVSEVGFDDDFFDLGGHSLIAIRVMGRIHQELGVRLQLATIFEAGTVAALASRVRSECPGIDERFGGTVQPATDLAETPRPSMGRHLVPITSEGSGRPLYIVHGAGGNVVFLWSLARAMSGQRPIYGFQAHGIEAPDLPDPTVEVMAERYVEELVAHGPGPYLLGGYSGGGVVALEMVRRLQARGERVDLVVLFDSVPPVGTVLRPWQRRANVVRHVVRHGVGPVTPYLRRQVADLVARLRPWRAAAPSEEALVAAERHGYVNLYHYFSAATWRYHVTTYDVDVVVLKADLAWPVQPEDYHWRRHVTGELTVLTVPGSHHTMFFPEHAPRLVDVLGPVLASRDAATADDDASPTSASCTP